MKQSIVEFLACPRCAGPLEIDSETISQRSEPAEIESGSLNCQPCSLSFPIEGGIPRFVRADWAGQTDIHTGERFGDSWKRFSRLHEKYTQQFFDWVAPVSQQFVKDKVVLDAGCGKGRHVNIVAHAGARAVIAADIGSAIEVAYRNVGHLSNVHVIQADLKDLPLKPCFDWIYSTGVLHHMQEPAGGFAAIKTKLNPTGALSVWVYGRESNGWIIHFINPLRTAITSKMPSLALNSISLMAACIVSFVSRFMARPWANIQARHSWLPSLFYQKYLAYIADFDLLEIHHIVFDHLTAPVAYYLPKTEVERWYQSQGFPNAVIRWHNQNSWSGFGTIAGNSTEEVFYNTAVAPHAEQPATDPVKVERLHAM